MADPTDPPVVLNGSPPPPPPLLPEPESSDAGDSDGVAELWVAGVGTAAGVTAAAVDFDSTGCLFTVELLEGLLSSAVVEDGGTSAVVGSAFLVGLGVGVTSTGVLLAVVGEGSLSM